jgi:hypothetical protein
VLEDHIKMDRKEEVGAIGGFGLAIDEVTAGVFEHANGPLVSIRMGIS